MKFPSIVKTNKFSRFHYEPRYYDEVKEEIEAKMKAARARANQDDTLSRDTSSISKAFSRRERKSSQTSVIQIIIAAAMLATFVGWMFYGNDVFYIYLLISPVYFYFRLKGKNKSKD